MNNAQKALCKTYIQTNFSANVAASEWSQISEAMSTAASPITKAWATSVSADVLDDAPDYSTFDTIAAGKRDSWGFLLARSRDFTRSKTRKWITDIWGNATAGSNAEAILQAALVNATGAEVAIGGTVVSTGTVSGLKRDYIGGISVGEVNALMSVP